MWLPRNVAIQNALSPWFTGDLEILNNIFQKPFHATSGLTFGNSTLKKKKKKKKAQPSFRIKYSPSRWLELVIFATGLTYLFMSLKLLSSLVYQGIYKGFVKTQRWLYNFLTWCMNSQVLYFTVLVCLMEISRWSHKDILCSVPSKRTIYFSSLVVPQSHIGWWSAKSQLVQFYSCSSFEEKWEQVRPGETHTIAMIILSTSIPVLAVDVFDSLLVSPWLKYVWRIAA